MKNKVVVIWETVSEENNQNIRHRRDAAPHRSLVRPESVTDDQASNAGES
jgi:hypothetical protein